MTFQDLKCRIALNGVSNGVSGSDNHSETKMIFDTEKRLVESWCHFLVHDENDSGLFCRYAFMSPYRSLLISECQYDDKCQGHIMLRAC